MEKPYVAVTTPAPSTRPPVQLAVTPSVLTRPMRPPIAATAPTSTTGNPAPLAVSRLTKLSSRRPANKVTAPSISSAVNTMSRPPRKESHNLVFRTQTDPKKLFQNAKSGASFSPSTMTLSVKSFAKPSFAPRSTKNVPSVTMKLGKEVRSTREPLTHPTPTANRNVSGMAMTRGKPAPPNSPVSLTSSTTSMPVAPVIAPDDRSNSPPIIRSATATAMMPKVADTSM